MLVQGRVTVATERYLCICEIILPLLMIPVTIHPENIAILSEDPKHLFFLNFYDPFFK